MRATLFLLCAQLALTAAALTKPTIDPLNYPATPDPHAVLVTFATDSSTRGFAWETDTSVAETKVWLLKGSFAAADDARFAAEGTVFSGTYLDKTQSDLIVRCHKVQITSGLQAGATYSYRLGGSGHYAYGRFAIGEAAAARVTMLTLSDAQVKYTPSFYVWENTVSRAADIVPPASVDCVLFGGDMFDVYASSISAYNYLKWAAAVDSATRYFPDIPWALSSGNHDLDKNDYQYYRELTGVTYSDSLCHSFDYGPMHVCVLPFVKGEDAANYTGVAQWLAADLTSANAAARTTWNVVMIHWGPYTTGDHGYASATTKLVELFCPVFSAGHVDLVLQAHDHTYSKTLPYRWDTCGYATSRDDAAIVNVSPATAVLEDEVYDLNPEGTYYVSAGCSGPRVAEGNGEYAYIGAAKSYEQRTYKIATGKIAVDSVYGKKGDDGSSELYAAMFGVLRADAETLTYDWYAVNTNGLEDAVLYDTLRVCKAPANAFRVTPYVQRPATNAMSILWLAQTNGAARLTYWPVASPEAAVSLSAVARPSLASDVTGQRFGAADNALEYCLAPELGYACSANSADNTMNRYNAWTMPYTTPWQYRVRLTGLAPDTAYAYRVELVGTNYVNTFRTPPSRDPATWRGLKFIYYSDSETEPADNDSAKGLTPDWTVPGSVGETGNRKYYITQTTAYRQNILEAQAFGTELIVMAGDLAQKGSRQCDWDEFWRHNAGPLNDPAGSVPVLASPGNHDYWDYGDGGECGLKKYMSYMEVEPNDAGVDRDQQERFHRVDYGPATFIFLDGNNGDDCPTNHEHDTNLWFSREKNGCRAPDFNPGSLQYAWLERQLKDAQQHSAFTFIVTHQCPFSVGYHGRENYLYDPATKKDVTSGRDNLSGRPLRVLLPLLHKYGVDGWFAGHDEMMERSTDVGEETLADGTKVAHTLNIWDMGIAGDGLRGSVMAQNPQEAFRADTGCPEVYDAEGLLIEGGKHYGHLEVTIEKNADGRWQATFDPIYLLYRQTGETSGTYVGKRSYPDRIVRVSNRCANPSGPGLLLMVK